ncbi:MAG: hypothetical protein ACFB10_06095 [Salibacteraceae bacterium]
MSKQTNDKPDRGKFLKSQNTGILIFLIAALVAVATLFVLFFWLTPIEIAYKSNTDTLLTIEAQLSDRLYGLILLTVLSLFTTIIYLGSKGINLVERNNNKIIRIEQDELRRASIRKGSFIETGTKTETETGTETETETEKKDNSTHPEDPGPPKS